MLFLQLFPVLSFFLLIPPIPLINASYTAYSKGPILPYTCLGNSPFRPESGEAPYLHPYYLILFSFLPFDFPLPTRFYHFLAFRWILSQAPILIAGVPIGVAGFYY